MDSKLAINQSTGAVDGFHGPRCKVRKRPTVNYPVLKWINEHGEHQSATFTTIEQRDKAIRDLTALGLVKDTCRSIRGGGKTIAFGPVR